MKKCSKIVSMLLMLALLISPLSVAAMAEEVLQPAVSAVESENAAEEAYIVEEDESLRDEFSKHFINSDGTYTAVTYAEAVHYQDGDEWEEIDNTLVSVTENGKQVYTNRSGGIADIPKVTFQQNEADKTASISVDGYSISWNVRAKTDATKYAQYKVEEAALSQSAEVVGSNIATAAVVPESSVTITAVSEYIKANGNNKLF